MLANQVGLSNQFVSERHYYAKQEKLTAGDAAKIIRKSGISISAKEVVSSFKLLANRDPEWHHAGFYKGSGGSTMGRTFFFSNEDVEMIISRYSEIGAIIESQNANIEMKKQTTVKGFYYSWDYDYGGNYGKKRNFKVLKTYEGSELYIPRGFVSLSDSEFENAEEKAGKKYFGWDEPYKGEFQNTLS